MSLVEWRGSKRNHPIGWAEPGFRHGLRMIIVRQVRPIRSKSSVSPVVWYENHGDIDVDIDLDLDIDIFDIDIYIDWYWSFILMLMLILILILISYHITWHEVIVIWYDELYIFSFSINPTMFTSNQHLPNPPHPPPRSASSQRSTMARRLAYYQRCRKWEMAAGMMN